MRSLWILALLAVPASALLADPKKARAKLSPVDAKDIPTKLIHSGACGAKVNRTKESAATILGTYEKSHPTKKVSLLQRKNPAAGGDAAEIASDLEAMEQ